MPTHCLDSNPGKSQKNNYKSNPNNHWSLTLLYHFFNKKIQTNKMDEKVYSSFSCIEETNLNIKHRCYLRVNGGKIKLINQSVVQLSTEWLPLAANRSRWRYTESSSKRCSGNPTKWGGEVFVGAREFKDTKRKWPTESKKRDL